MPSISEGQRPSADFTTDDDEEMTENGEEADISLDVSLGENSPSTQGGPTPPKVARGEGSPSKGQLSPTASTVSWEYQTPIAGGAKNKVSQSGKIYLYSFLTSSCHDSKTKRTHVTACSVLITSRLPWSTPLKAVHRETSLR